MERDLVETNSVAGHELEQGEQSILDLTAQDLIAVSGGIRPVATITLEE